MLLRLAAVVVVVSVVGAATWRTVGRPAVDQAAVARSAPPPSAPTPAKTELALGEDDRTYLWETENVAFQIAYKTGPALSTAVAAGDSAAVAEFLAAGFRGSLFQEDRGEAVVRSFAKWSLFSSSKNPRRNVGREAFAEWLAGLSLRFRTRPQVQLAVMNLAPDDRKDLSGPWTGMWQIRLCGEQGKRAPEKAATGAAIGELFPAPFSVQNGAPLEIVAKCRVRWKRAPADFFSGRGWISGWEPESLTIASSDRRLMRDVTREWIPDLSELHDNWTAKKSALAGVPGGVYACDVNGDGKIDLLVTDVARARLYLNRGDRFSEVALEWGLPADRPQQSAALLVDLDNDGDEDLILGNGVYENIGGAFVRRATLPLPHLVVGFAAADYDRDGLVDFYVANTINETDGAASKKLSWLGDEEGPGNQLFRNLGGFRFEDVTAKANASAGHRYSFTAGWTDVDGDGWPDLYVLNELGNNVLLMNQRDGTFKERHVGPKNDGFAMGLAVGDLNEDGRMDLYIGNMKSKVGMRVVANLPPNVFDADVIDKMKRWVGGNVLLTAKGDGDFAEQPCGMEGGGWSYGPALVDFDGDGRLDVFSTCGFVSRDRRKPDG